MSQFRAALKYGGPALILAAAAAGALALYATRPEPQKRPPGEPGMLVETRELERRARRLDVSGSGEVIPSRALALEPQVSGRLEWVNPDLVPGGTIEEGEKLYQIEQREYVLAIREARAQRAQARAELARARAEHEVAKTEWERFGRELAGGADAPALALREPQLESARVAVQSANAAVERAELALSRTSYDAPFDVLVVSEEVELGDTIAPGQPIAQLVGLESFWVEVALPAENIDDLEIPGALAAVTWDTGSRRVQRTGRVVRLLGSLGEAGRMARVLVEIPDPYAMESGGERLLLGAYVEVEISGQRSESLIALPREALYEGDQALVFVPEVGDRGHLAIRRVEVVWRRPDEVLVSSGVGDGDRVVVSNLPRPVEGMKLRRAEEAEAL